MRMWRVGWRRFQTSDAPRSVVGQCRASAMLVRSMTDKHPFNYARGVSGDVVRKKFRRRVVMFAVVSVVVTLIGCGWAQSLMGEWSIADRSRHPITIASANRSVWVAGPRRTNILPGQWKNYQRRIGRLDLGILLQHNIVGYPKWVVVIPYRNRHGNQ